MAVQGVFSPHWLSFSLQGRPYIYTVQEEKKCLAHGSMEWTSVDSCMATSRQGPHPNHVEGITNLQCNFMWFHFWISLVLQHFIQAVYNNMSGSAFRRNNMARLHVFPGEEVELLPDRQKSVRNYTCFQSLLEIYLLSKLPFDARNRFFRNTHFRFQRRSWKMWHLKYLK